MQERIHEQTGGTIRIAGTSYRAVTFETFGRELMENDLEILKKGITAIEPDYGSTMYAVVKRKS